MSEITGTALRYDGLPVDYVSIFNWEDGKCIAQVIPDAEGGWTYEYDASLKIGITYVSEGCEPLTHGSYEFVGNWKPILLQPKLYLDTDSAVWVGDIGSNLVSWTDKTGNQSDFLGVGSVTKTSDGGVSIPSGNNCLYNSTAKAKGMLSGIGKAWIFAVVKLRADNATIFHVTDAANLSPGYNPRLAFQYVGGRFRHNSSRNVHTTSNMFLSSPAPMNTYHMVLLEHDWQTGRVAWYVNGALDTFNDNQITDKGVTNSSVANNSVFIGQYATSNNSVPQDIKMLSVITDKELTQSDIDKLFGYAAHKHGLTSKLPASHPYKTEIPT